MPSPEVTETLSDKVEESAESIPDAEAGKEAAKEIIDELTNVGQKLIVAIESAWNSEQRKKVEDDVRSGLVTVASSVEDGIKRVSQTKEAQSAVNAAEDVADKMMSSKVAAELSSALAHGLRAISEMLEKFSTDMKHKSQEAADSMRAAADEVQDIPIDVEKAAKEVKKQSKEVADSVKEAVDNAADEVKEATGTKAKIG